jgi:hypothetical protein
MIMKNVLGAIALLAIGSAALTGSANALPAASVAAIGGEAAPVAQQVHWYARYDGNYGYYRHDYWWRKYCYYHPYYWRCDRFGY